MDQPRLYNSRITHTYINYLKKNYPLVDIDELLSYARMAPYEAADQGHWFTQEQVNRFHEKIVELTGDINIARQAGRYAGASEAIGVMRQYILGFLNPSKVYEKIEKTARQFSRSCKLEYTKINSKKIEITATPHKGVTEQKFQCENRTGHFESIALLFNNKMPKIEHPECIFKGGTKCRYIISWESNLFSVLKRIRNSIAFITGVAGIVLIILFPLTTAVNILFLPALAVFGLTAYFDYLTKRELRSSLLYREKSHEDLIRQMDINYNNSLMINEIGQAISKQVSIESILKMAIKILKNRLDYDRCMFFMRNENKNIISFKAGFGYTPGQLKILKKSEFKLNQQKSKDILIASFNEKKPYLINDISSIEKKLSPQSSEFIKDMAIRSFICCPIVCGRESMGIVTVDNVKTKRPLIQSDLRLLTGITSVIGISIKNTELNDARAQQLQSILKVLAASIDARDPYTAGHSERVTDYAIGICKEMRVPRDYTEVVAIAASLHDYGKIGIDDSLLKKKGPLKDEEREIIKTHAEKTREILEQINFMGKYKKIPEIAGSHHEKLDGSGYPRGLKGVEIPLGSRIIAVADFFEAITSKRHYRNSLPTGEAFDLLSKESGIHFDEKIVKAFVTYYRKTKLREEYRSLLTELDKQKSNAKRRRILNKIELLRKKAY